MKNQKQKTNNQEKMVGNQNKKNEKTQNQDKNAKKQSKNIKGQDKMNYNDYFGPMEEGHVYHLYNQGNNGEKIFKNNIDKERFRDRMFTLLSPFIAILAYSLMNNHFHIAFRVKTWTEIFPNIKLFNNLDKFVKNFHKTSKTRFIGWNITSAVISEMFRRLLMGYAKYYNKKYNRSGSLFRKGFRHKEVTDKLYLQALIAYINRNPMHHGYKIDYRKYEWSSYSPDYEKFPPMGIDLEELRVVYGSVTAYIYYHENINVPEYVME